MKNKSLIVCLFITLTLTTACSSSFNSPEDAINNLCQSIQNSDLEKASTSFDNSNGIRSDYKNIANETHLFSSSASQYINKNNKKMTYEIISKDEDDTGTNIVVRFTYIDATDVLTETLDLYIDEVIPMLSPNSELSTKDSLAIFNTNLDKVANSADENFVNIDLTFHLREKDKSYLIDSYDPNLFNVITNNFVSSYLAYS